MVRLVPGDYIRRFRRQLSPFPATITATIAASIDEAIFTHL